MRLSNAIVIPILAVLACGFVSMAGESDDSRLRLYVSGGQVALGSDEQGTEALRHADLEQGVLLECREIRFSARPSKAIQLDCLDATVLRVSGIRGFAPWLRLDSSRGTITLTGTNERPVQLLSGFDAEDRPTTRISAERVMIDLPQSRARVMIDLPQSRAMILQGARALVSPGSWPKEPPTSSKPCVPGGCDVPAAPESRSADITPRD